MAAAGELPIQKVSISGAALASIIQRFASSPGDVDGLLFGHVTRLPPPALHDDDDPAFSAPAPSPLAAAVTGHFSSARPMSFYDPLGRVDGGVLRRVDGSPGGSSLLGWFSGRRRTPLRPSMREQAVSVSLFKTLTLGQDPVRPLVFLLLSASSTANLAVHTHEYRAFVLQPVSGSLEPCSVEIVNVGPAFRGQYSLFSPESAFPMVPFQLRGFEEGGMEEESRRRDSVSFARQSAKDQMLLDSSVEGFGLERLRRMAGLGAADYTFELEDLYGKQLLKLKSLAKLVEKSSAKVLEQESRNLILRSKVAGLE